MGFAVIVFPGSNCDHDCFHAISKLLKKPVKRIALPHVPHPTSYALEEVMYTDFNDIVKNVNSLFK